MPLPAAFRPDRTGIDPIAAKRRQPEGPSTVRRYGPALLLLLFSVIMLSPLIFGGRVFFYRDFGRYYAPVKAVCMDRMLGGEFPVWMPELSCGTPIHGELVHGLMYPGNVFLFFGESLGWGLYFAFHLFLAGLGARALARHLGAGPIGALAAGIAFAGSGYLVAQMNHVPYVTAGAWIPFVILLGLRAGDGRTGATPLLALALTMTALAGEPFTIVLGVGLLVILILSGLSASRARALVRLGAAGAAALLLASPALLPALRQVDESVRAGAVSLDEGVYGSIHPVRLFTLLSPEALGRQQLSLKIPIWFFGMKILYFAPVLTNLHLGAVALLSVLMAVFRRTRVAVVLSATFLGALLLSLGAYLGVSTFLVKWVPGLSFFRYPDKYWFVVTLAAAILTGVTLDHLTRRSARVAFVLAALALGFGWHLDTLGTALMGALPFALAGVVLQVFPERGKPVLVAILFLDLLYFGLRVNVTVPPEEIRREDGIASVLTPFRPNRIFVNFQDGGEEDVIRNTYRAIIRSYNALEPNVGMDRGFHYSFGYDPVQPIARLDLYFGLPMDMKGPIVSRLRHRLLRLTDTTVSITNAWLGGDPEVETIITGPSGIRAYQYLNPLPRARLYGDTVNAESAEQARTIVQNPRFDPDRFLILEGTDLPIQHGPPVGSVAYDLDQPEHVRLSVRSDRSAWLFLADSWSRGWEATVNGSPVAIRHADVAFRAVPVPEGESVVDFRYRPAWIGEVPYTFLAGIVFLLVLLVPWLRTLRFVRRGQGA